MNNKTEKKLIEFFEFFEVVFDKDWHYSKQMMGIYDYTEADRKHDEEMGLEAIDIISDKGTFLSPQVEDESEDWGNRALLLNAYRELKSLLQKDNVL